jgi:hypothetical protein
LEQNPGTLLTDGLNLHLPLISRWAFGLVEEIEKFVWTCGTVKQTLKSTI